MNNTIEKQILYALINDENYSRKVMPYIKPEYFSGEDKVLFKSISDFIHKYNRVPTCDALIIEIDATSGIPEEQAKTSVETLEAWQKASIAPVNEQWLLDTTETFCQDKALYLAMMKSLEIMKQKEGSLSKGAIPGIMSEALAISFDPNIGHDFFADAEARWEFYHRKEERIPFDIELLNKITKGGLVRKSLTILLAGTNVGKSLVMCHMAAANLVMGKNVLYITLEMSEEKISERIDANLLNIALDDLESLPKDLYLQKISKLQSKTNGRLMIKEYPTSQASAQNFRNVLNELRLKSNFVPDIIYIDYINLCTSSRLNSGSNANSYTFIKAIAEEIRGLAVEFNVPIVSATQTTRSGYDNSDIGLTDTSESFGLPATADLMLAITETEELVTLGQYMFKQLKNRYGTKDYYTRFVVGVEKAKMKLYDADSAAQAGITEAGYTDADIPKKTDKFKGLKV